MSPADLSDAELAQLDALVDEPASDAPEAANASESVLAATEAGISAPEVDEHERSSQRKIARELLGSMDGALWLLAGRSVTIEGGASFHTLVEVRDRALAGANGEPSGSP